MQTAGYKIERLAQTLQPDEGVQVGLLMRFNYAYSEDIVVAGNELSGGIWDNLRVSFDGSLGAFEYFIQTESASAAVLGPAGLLDAWVRTPLNDQVRMTMGLFPQPFLMSSGIEPQNLLLI